MGALVINAPDWETLAVLRTARSIYASGHVLDLAEYVRLQRRFNSVYEAHQHEPAVAKLTAAVRDYHERIEALGLRDYHFSEHYTPAQTLRWMLLNAARSAVCLPLALPGVLLHAPIYLLTKLLHWKAAFAEERTQFKMFILFLVLPVEVLALLAAVYWWRGAAWLGAALVLLPLFQYVHVKLLERGVSSLRSVRLLARLAATTLFMSADVRALKRQREAIRVQMAAMVDHLYPAAKVRPIMPGDGGASSLRSRAVDPGAASEYADRYI